MLSLTGAATVASGARLTRELGNSAGHCAALTRVLTQSLAEQVAARGLSLPQGAHAQPPARLPYRSGDAGLSCELPRIGRSV